MRVLLDTNIILDVILERENFYDIFSFLKGDETNGIFQQLG